MPNLIWELGADGAPYRKELAETEAATGGSFNRMGVAVAKESGGMAESVEGVHKTIKRLKEFIMVGGLVEAFRRFYEAGVQWAEKHKDANDEDVRSMFRLKDSVEKFSNLSGRAFATVTGWMEKFGLAVGSLVYGVDSAAEAYNKMEQESKKALDVERTKEVTRVTEELAKARRDAAFEEADDNGKINILLAERLKLTNQLSEMKRGSIEYTQKEVEIAKLDMDLQKVSRDEKKKADEDSKKAAADRLQDEKKIAGSLQQQAEFLTLSHKVALGIATGPEKERLSLLQLQRTELETALKIEALSLKSLTGELTPAEQDRLDKLVKQDEKLKDQIKAKQALIASTADQKKAEEIVTAEYQKQIEAAQTLNKEFKNFTLSLSRTGTSYDQQSTESLSGVRDRLQSELTAAKIDVQHSTIQRDGSLYNPAVNFFATELAKVNQELKLRKSVQDYASRYGETAARYQYGDTVTQRALSNLADQSNRAAIATEQINQRLNAAGFGINGPISGGG